MIEDKDKKRKKTGLLVLLALCIAALTFLYFLPSDKPVIPESKLKEASAALQTILQIKENINDLRIDTLTSTNYIKARKAEHEGNNAFSEGEYARALPYFNDAINLYQAALKEEPAPPPITITPDEEEEPEVTRERVEEDKPKHSTRKKSNGELGQLRQQLESARSAMLQARSAASAADATNLAPNDWQSAENKKGEGDRRYNSGSDNKSSIETNIKSYEKAKELYNKAAQVAKSKKEG